MENTLSHIDSNGKAKMVDVSGKIETERVAVAKASIKMNKNTLILIENGGMEKGDVLGTARIAGIMASKKTSDLIPMCHPLMINCCKITFEVNKEESEIIIEATVKTTGKTGVEMEALTAATTTALTIYDMCKAVDKLMKIENIYVMKKSGGKSGDWSL